jgi:hypothetical protein
MKRIVTALSIVGLWASSFGTVHAAGIGVVAGIRGEATVRRDRAPQAQQLKFKDDLFWQDTLSTGTDASLRLLIQQKNVVTMKELTQLQLREELVGPNQAKKKSVVDLLSGTVRVVVDKDALKDSDYEVRTNMAVAAIRGSDVVGQTGKDRVKFCVGPESSATAIHRDPAVGRRELHNLQCADVSPDEIDITTITLDGYLILNGTTSPPPGGGGGGPPPGFGPNNNIIVPPPPPKITPGPPPV